jgi:hypothetical protein
MWENARSAENSSLSASLEADERARVEITSIKRTPVKAAKLPEITEEPSMEDMSMISAEEIIDIGDHQDNQSEGSGLALETEEVQVNPKKGLAEIFKGF